MKKKYITPACKVISFEEENELLTGSPLIVTPPVKPPIGDDPDNPDDNDDEWFGD